MLFATGLRKTGTTLLRHVLLEVFRRMGGWQCGENGLEEENLPLSTKKALGKMRDQVLEDVETSRDARISSGTRQVRMKCEVEAACWKVRFGTTQQSNSKGVRGT